MPSILHDSVAEAGAPSTLKEFFEAWRQLAEPAEPSTSLLAFFKEYRALQSALPEPIPEPVPAPRLLDPEHLVQFCEDFRPVFAKLQREGEFVDIWSVAGLKRDELRHASVLAWLLDPNGSHGFEQDILQAWMSTLKFPGEPPVEPRFMPAIWKSPYWVMTEVCPQDGTNRIDIEISSEAFYLCVEVNIDAPEGDNQLLRYVPAVEAKAGSRPFGVVFLSRVKPATLSTDSSPYKYRDKVIATTWAGFAAAVRSRQKTCPSSSRGLSRRLLDQFLNRVENL
jgi:PD-(D/E)XK nuclease superfamily